ncbi:hypothetical protein ABZ816_30230 [Actinosynnema sp. NPDC047251]|uniref:Putative membrane protein n=1 Tax=Saccharothrix espanaensis (strain ATCC 51144 / DSM 44229 / JCM 9112 / NBRC 15066 / NRRL 15764) TaxID=1179773 RepID=K0KAV8_SACES|nr:hypothetical protein [Saccharothrix espanaensis]CCH34642.1 putative membrane protein [Saccharothrix espanaensis DSM 44229]
MTTAPPPARDLPPGRHSAIRDEIGRAITGPRPFRYAPLVAAAGVVALALGLSVLAPWQARDTAGPADSAPTADMSDLTPQRIAEIEAGCAESAMVDQQARLYQYREDRAGKYALLFTPDYLLPCAVDDWHAPFNSPVLNLSALDWLPGHFSVDHTGGLGGGEAPGVRPVRPGRAGWRVAAGRVDAEVARVTYSFAGTTVDATVVNGTYLARIVYPPQWALPYDGTTGEVRAYDKNGKVLGTSLDIKRQCYLRPDGAVVYGGQFSSDPSTCLPAVPWR